MIIRCNTLLVLITIGIALTATSTTDSLFVGAPKIIPETSEITLENGTNYTLECKGRKVQFKQQEMTEDITEPFYTQHRLLATNDSDIIHISLTLYNVNQYTVGYYACFDDSLNASDILNNLREEPENNDHITYIYIYVSGSESLIAPMREIVTANDESKVVIGCRPTAPDVKVKLTLPQNNKAIQENVKFSPKIGFLMKLRRSAYACEGHRGNETNRKIINVQSSPPTPNITATTYYLKNETFSMNCTVHYQKNVAISLYWETPKKSSFEKEDFLSRSIIETNEHNVTNGILYNNITIFNATNEDAGTYECVSKKVNANKTIKYKKILLEKAFINVSSRSQLRVELNKKHALPTFDVYAYPPVSYSIFKNGAPITLDGIKYDVSYPPNSNNFRLKIMNLVVSDTANYTIIFANSYLQKKINYDLRVKAKPEINFEPNSDEKKYVQNTTVTLWCDVTGYPLPKVTWLFDSQTGRNYSYEGKNEEKSLYELTSYLKMRVDTSGNVTCISENASNRTEKTRRFLVYEVPDGFGIMNKENNWFVKNDQITKQCRASLYDFDNVTWVGDAVTENMVSYSKNNYSYIADLELLNNSLNQSTNYTCIGHRANGSKYNDTIQITVEEQTPPLFIEPLSEAGEELYPYQRVKISCAAIGVPRPTITWYKDDAEFKPMSNISSVIIANSTKTYIRSVIDIREMREELGGKYHCVAANKQLKKMSAAYNLVVNVKPVNKTIYLSAIGIIFFCLVILVIYLIIKIKKEKQFKKVLADAGLLYFNKGQTKSLNPDIGIDEQAELLPYDNRFEFPSEKLKLGKQLGSGAFGVVYKAEARGILNAEDTTIVAVKMVKKTDDNLYIKALASELKIMVHMGKHINIVNLLGACTKNVGKRELSVIVEYCKFGNIHNYMIKHREVFIDQLTDNAENTIGRVNRGFSYSGNSGYNSDYFGSNHTQNTDHSFLNTVNTNRSGRTDTPKQPNTETGKVSESGYMQPPWRSNYEENEYSEDGRTPRPLCSRDLLCWAFQIARGMEYLASRKVLHGDLAARNILLAEDNVIKICDFGFARSMYKNDEYQKKENCPLPIKWLAIECITDRIFSTQSDVWSFGIVLWELFSLAKTPYPNVNHTDLLQWLSDGHRLAKPRYSDDRLYKVMMQCWSQKPTSRPTFTQLQETIGTFLEDNVRNHYVDLNSTYIDMNAVTRATANEDYLAMVSAPDYNELVTPSPRHYANQFNSFFPHTSKPQEDEEGYLQVSPSPHKVQLNAPIDFDFDPRKLNTRCKLQSDTNSNSSESTPMLTLNNLPTRSGSESDQEGNSIPYQNHYPRIEEEMDEVFDAKENNIKNFTQSRAVTNPTYIIVNNDKKPQDISYVNVSNGLVN